MDKTINISVREEIKHRLDAIAVQDGQNILEAIDSLVSKMLERARAGLDPVTGEPNKQ